MSFLDITIAQRTANYTNFSDPSATLVSLSKDGAAVLRISQDTATFITQNLSQANAKPVLVSTGGGVLFLAGDYVAPNLNCSLVRIVEAVANDESGEQ